ncbi:MAG: hypothetical protein KGL46_09760 [Hyphomicrobiales bacterium]|nr:hypothetical protein [Hyphomicrobiales bacterium]
MSPRDTTESAKPDYFGGDDALDLSDFAPGAGQGTPQHRPDPAAVRELQAQAQKSGFTRREPDAAPMRLSRVNIGATTTLYLRVTPHDFNRFVGAANAAGLGRADFLVRLLDDWERASSAS